MQYFEFADNVAVAYSSKDQKLVANKIETAITEIEAWFKRWGQVVSFVKTKAMYFTNKHGQPREIEINGTKLEYVQKHKFLGMHFDGPRLTWSKHIEYLKYTCNKSLNNEIYWCQNMGNR